MSELHLRHIPIYDTNRKIVNKKRGLKKGNANYWAYASTRSRAVIIPISLPFLLIGSRLI